MGASTFQGLIELDCKALERCARHGLTVNRSKSIMCAPSIDFVQAGESKVKAISDFPVPTTRTDLRSFMGLVNQLGSFHSKVANASIPLRQLLCTRNEFRWLPAHDETFKKTKAALISPPVPVMFDKSAETYLHKNESKNFGLGFALMQRTKWFNRLEIGSMWQSLSERLSDTWLSWSWRHWPFIGQSSSANFISLAYLTSRSSQIISHSNHSIVKHLLTKCGGNVDRDQFHSGLLELRNSPRVDGLSPTPRLFGHPIRSLVPAHWRSFDKRWQLASEEVDRRRLEDQKKRKTYFDRSAKPRYSLNEEGSFVLVKDTTTSKWDTEAKIIGKADRR